MPLDAERKGWRASDSDCFDSTIFGHTLDDDPLTRLENALTMKGVDANGPPTKESCEGAVRNEIDIMAVGEHDGGIWMNFACLQSWHPVVDAPRQLADLGMK